MGVRSCVCLCVRVCVDVLNGKALFEAIESGEKLNHACANVNWLCTVQWCGTERGGEGWRGTWGEGETMLVYACWRTRMCLRKCVCGLDQPPEFTQRLRQDWGWGGGGRRCEKGGNKGRPAGNQGRKKTIDFFPSSRMCLFSEAGKFKRIVSKGLQVDFSSAVEALWWSRRGFGVQPQGTLRDEETCVLAWNNKIHQVFIKLSGKGRIAKLLLSCSFRRVEEQRWGCVARRGSITERKRRTSSDEPNEAFLDAVCQTKEEFFAEGQKHCNQICSVLCCIVSYCYVAMSYVSLFNSLIVVLWCWTFRGRLHK